MTRIIGIAAAQVAPVVHDPAATFDKFAAEVRNLTASVPAVDLLIFPELYLTAIGSFGTSLPPGYLADTAEPIPGPLSDRISELAVEVGRWIVPGTFMERAGDRLHNTAIAVSPEGEVVTRYRKIFPWMPYETCTPGDEYVTFDIPGKGRFGLAICYDGWVPEIPRTLTWMGADVILQPTFTSTADRAQEQVLARANAIANQVYVVNPNAGRLFGTGGSIIVDPEGRVLAEGGSGEEFLTAYLDLDLVATVREHGTLGLNTVWKQLRDAPPPFPPATAGYRNGEVMRPLGELRNFSRPTGGDPLAHGRPRPEAAIISGAHQIASAPTPRHSPPGTA